MICLYFTTERTERGTLSREISLSMSWIKLETIKIFSITLISIKYCSILLKYLENNYVIIDKHVIRKFFQRIQFRSIIYIYI